MKKLYIHIGLEKTGSTSLQFYLQKNRDALLKHNIMYPDIGYKHNSQAHFKLCAPLFLKENPDASLDFAPFCNFEADEVWNQLKNQILYSDSEHFIISAETFSSKLKKEGIDYIYQFSQSLKKNVVTKVVVYVRRQDDFFVSALSTMAKTGKTTSVEQELEKALAGSYYYNHLENIKRWEMRFGKKSLIVRPFLKSAWKNGSLIDDFFSSININWHTVDDGRGKKINQSINSKATILGLKLNTISKDLGVSFLNREALLHKVSKIFPEEDKVLSIKEARDILYFYENDNKKLSEYFFNEKEKNMYLNDLAEISFTDDRVYLTEQDIAKILLVVWSELAK